MGFTTTAPPPPIHYRSLPILITYLTICALLAAQKCLNIVRGYRQNSSAPSRLPCRKIVFFALQALLSLTATWYHMFRFFNYSYTSWATTTPTLNLATLPSLTRWELWLRERKLFREAWESVSDSPERFWWSGQIFLFAVGWSLILGVVGQKYKIPNVWSFMLLGQIVAISFAQNLFVLTVLVSGRWGTGKPAKELGREKEREKELVPSPPAILELAPVVTSLASAVVVPHVAHTRLFMPVLLVPHLLLFVPGLLPVSGGSAGAGRSLGWYRWVFWWVGGAAVVIQARSTYAVLVEGDVCGLTRRLFDAMVGHPAVSSVGWDVVFCFVGLVASIVLDPFEM